MARKKKGKKDLKVKEPLDKKNGNTIGWCERSLQGAEMESAERCKNKKNHLKACEGHASDCPCRNTEQPAEGNVDLIVLIDTSGSMKPKAESVSAAADAAITRAKNKCPTDLRVDWLGIEGTFPNTKFNQRCRQYLLGINPGANLTAAITPGDSSWGHKEEGADSIADLSNYYDWREGACRAIFYISDEPLDLGGPQEPADDTATQNAITMANKNNVTVFTHLAPEDYTTNPGTVKNYTDLCAQTGGEAFIGNAPSEKEYSTLLEKVICNACGGCKALRMPEIKPCISVSWGDSDCDCIETDDYETLCVTVCNCYSNISFKDLTISGIKLVTGGGNPVPILPDGTPSVELFPHGPVCYGDIGPCTDGKANCKSREFVLITRGAKFGPYSLKLGAVCFSVSHQAHTDACFDFELCKER